MRKVLLVVLVLLLAGLFGADRFAESKVESAVADQIQTEYGLTARPTVAFGGWPFLTQAIGGKYDSIDVRIGDYTEQGITLQDVAVHIQGLNAPLGDVLGGDTQSLVADKATASAVIPYGVVQKALTQRGVKKVSRDGDDMRLDGTYTFQGIEVPIALTVALQVTGEGVVAVPQTAEAVGIQVPLSAVKQYFTTTIPVTGLPLGSKITSVVPVDNGLKVTGEATNVPLNAKV